jgi:hypothetical protein
MAENPLRDAYRYHRAYGQPAALAVRLARADVDMNKRRYPSSLSSPWNRPFAAYGEKHLRWIKDTSRAGLRFVGFADEIAGLRHNGWYTDECHDETYRGAVYQLPARHGESVYVYGYQDPINDGAALLSFDRTEDKDTAARWADHVAERAAEQEREQERDYQEASTARLTYDDMGEELARLRAKLFTLCRELRDERSLPPEICATLRKAIAEKWERRGELMSERAELAATYGAADGWRDQS